MRRYPHITLLSPVHPLITVLLLGLMISCAPARTETRTQDGNMQQVLMRYQPVLDLQGRMELMLELDAVDGLAYSKQQAVMLVPFLKALAAKPELQPGDVNSIRATLDGILGSKQRIWLNDRESSQRMPPPGSGPSGAPPGESSGGSFRGPPGGQSETAPSGPPAGSGAGALPEGAAEMIRAWSEGKSVNPFGRGGPGAKTIAKLIALLEAR
jgi:hypothetical protein